MKDEEEVLALWRRAKRARQTATLLATEDCNASVSRAYYAAFYAVSALFMREGRRFRKHSGIEAAVHRDLVHTGRWSKMLGSQYSFLLDARSVGDYGGYTDVNPASVERSLQAVKDILNAVQKLHPDLFR